MDSKLKRYILVRLGFIVVVFYIFAFVAYKASASVLNLEEVSATYTKFAHPNHSAYFPQEQKDAIAMDMKTNFLGAGIFNTNIHGTSDDSQYRLIGLKFDLGVDFGAGALYYEHHSQHILDAPNYYGEHFPVEDSINLKLYFYREK